MASIGDVPEILYLDNPQINNLFSYINEGKVVEQIDRSRETQSKDAAAGISKILELQFGSGSKEEDQTEMIKTMDSIGRFAVIYSNLEANDDIARFQDESINRETLSEGDFIEGKGKVKQNPINEVRSLVSQFAPFIDMMGSEGMKELSEATGNDANLDDLPGSQGVELIQSFVDELSDHEDIYHMNGPERFGNLVFTLNPNQFTETATDFPNEFTEYRILGRVDHVFEAGEQEYLIDIIDTMPENTSRRENTREEMMEGMTSGMSEALGRDIDENEFVIEHPDIRIRPMAVYLY